MLSLRDIISIIFVLSAVIDNVIADDTELAEKEYGVKYADPCEVCKFLSIELESRFNQLGQTSQVIETGYSLDAAPKKRIKYTKSELYLIEALDGVCDKILEYNVHKERTNSNRFDKGMSTTFKTLHDLVDKGVKVDLGIPYELWDTPSAEIVALKSQCEDSLEKFNDAIEQWYWGQREKPLQQYLCRERMLEKDQLTCLDDPPASPPVVGESREDIEDSSNDKKSKEDPLLTRSEL